MTPCMILGHCSQTLLPDMGLARRIFKSAGYVERVRRDEGAIFRRLAHGVKIFPSLNDVRLDQPGKTYFRAVDARGKVRVFRVQ